MPNHIVLKPVKALDDGVVLYEVGGLPESQVGEIDEVDGGEP